jgi:hypothetical protein
MTALYRQIDVWRRSKKLGLIRFRCFEVLPGGGFCVQSSDFFDSADAKRDEQLEEQNLELLLESAPDVRSTPFRTLIDAIEAHVREFHVEED